jgi:hypothetical protein
MVWLISRKFYASRAKSAVAAVETQRLRIEAELSFAQQRYSELFAEAGLKERRIIGLIEEREREIARRAALEAQVHRVADLEESLAEVERKLQTSYDRLGAFAAREAALARELEIEQGATSERLRFLEESQQKLIGAFTAIPAPALIQKNYPFWR